MDPKDEHGADSPYNTDRPEDIDSEDKKGRGWHHSSNNWGGAEVESGDRSGRSHQEPDTVPDWSELGRGTRKSPKGVREILKAYFNDTQIDRADEYHSFFTSWKQLAGINIAAHTHPRDIRGGVLIVEADHPGWVQLLHMQKGTILRKIRREYPQLEVKEIRIVVGNGGEIYDKNFNAPDGSASAGRSGGPSIQRSEPPEPAASEISPAPQDSDQAPQQPAQDEPKEEAPEAPEERQYKRRFEQALQELGKRVEERDCGDDTGNETEDE